MECPIKMALSAAYTTAATRLMTALLGCRSPPAQARLMCSGPTHDGHVRTGRDDFCRPCEAAGDAERRNVAAVACARAHACSMVNQ